MGQLLRALAVDLLILTVLCGKSFAGEPLAAYHERIDKIARDFATPERRPQIVAELMAIARDETNPQALRGVAVQALGKTGAKESEPFLVRLYEEALVKEASQAGNSQTEDLPGFAVARVAPKAIWQLRVANAGSMEEQEALLMRLLDGDIPSARGDGDGRQIREWAAQELASRGVEPAREHIIRFYDSLPDRSKSWTGNDLEICLRKLDLLAKYPDRLGAFKELVLTKGHGPVLYMLRTWAMEELAKLEQREAREYYLGYLRGLERQLYTVRGRWTQPVGHQNDAWNTAYGDYWRSIEALRRAGVSEAALESAGLHPTRNDRF